MSFIISVEANNTPRLQRHHSIKVENYEIISQLFTARSALNNIIALIF